MANDHRFDDAHQPGTPAGMDAGDVNQRNAVGKWFGKDIWPANTEEVRDKAREQGAPDLVLELLDKLPDRTFQNTQEVVDSLGIGVERRRQ